jgi:hypothetical protein
MNPLERFEGKELPGDLHIRIEPKEGMEDELEAGLPKIPPKATLSTPINPKQFKENVQAHAEGLSNVKESIKGLVLPSQLRENQKLGEKLLDIFERVGEEPFDEPEVEGNQIEGWGEKREVEDKLRVKVLNREEGEVEGVPAKVANLNLPGGIGKISDKIDIGRFRINKDGRISEKEIRVVRGIHIGEGMRELQIEDDLIREMALRHLEMWEQLKRKK